MFSVIKFIFIVRTIFEKSNAFLLEITKIHHYSRVELHKYMIITKNSHSILIYYAKSVI